MIAIIPIVLAIVPALLIVRYFHNLDKAQPESRSMIWKIFLLGVLVTIPTALLSCILDAINKSMDIPPLVTHFIRAFFIAGLVEESMKLWVVKRQAWPHFDEMTDGIYYAVVASMGFACLENILYTLEGGMRLALLRAFTAVPMHAIASGIMGYFIGKARFDKTRQTRHILTGLVIAVLLHGLYDFVLFAMPELGSLPALINIPLIIGGALVLVGLFNKAKQQDLETGRINNPVLKKPSAERPRGVTLEIEED